MIYLACPYWDENSATREYRVNQAKRAAALLSEAGELVYSPISHSKGIKEGVAALNLEVLHTNQHDYWMRHSIQMLENCSRIVVLCLDGWQESKGVQEEIVFAKANSIPLAYATIDRTGEVTALLTSPSPWEPAFPWAYTATGAPPPVLRGKDGSSPPSFSTPTEDLSLAEIANEVARWQSYNFEQSGGNAAFKGIVEELGELAHANLKAEQNIRGDQSHRLDEIDAVGDLLIYLCDYCNQRNIDIAAALSDTWSSVRERDWIRFPTNGKDS